MTMTLDELLALSKKLPPMTAEQLREQRKSFVRGQLGLMCKYEHLSKDALKALVEKADAELYGE